MRAKNAVRSCPSPGRTRASARQFYLTNNQQSRKLIMRTKDTKSLRTNISPPTWRISTSRRARGMSAHCCMVSPASRSQRKDQSRDCDHPFTSKGGRRRSGARERTQAPGLNDGMIIPPEEYSLWHAHAGHSDAAADRAPLAGVVRVIVVFVNSSDQKWQRQIRRRISRTCYFRKESFRPRVSVNTTKM